jgi:hypothetical protein
MRHAAGNPKEMTAVCPSFTFTKTVSKSYTEMTDTTNAINSAVGLTVGLETEVELLVTSTTISAEATASVSYNWEKKTSTGSTSDTTDSREVTYPSQVGEVEI